MSEFDRVRIIREVSYEHCDSFVEGDRNGLCNCDVVNNKLVSDIDISWYARVLPARVWKNS